jgi:hypothetical protein
MMALPFGNISLFNISYSMDTQLGPVIKTLSSMANKIHDDYHPSVQDLELAQGIKDSLMQAGFGTIDSILKNTPSQISNKLGIEPYVAQIIMEAAAKEATGEGSIV